MPIEQVIKLVGSLQLDSENINTWKNGVERALKNIFKTVPKLTERNVPTAVMKRSSIRKVA